MPVVATLQQTLAECLSMIEIPREQLDLFLRDVKNDPEDETAYLILADWLQDHDDPRGEMIALEVERLRHDFDSPRYRELGRTIDLLRAQYERSWMGSLLDLPIRWRYERGFFRLDVHGHHLVTEQVNEMIRDHAFDFVVEVQLLWLLGNYVERFAQSPILDVIPCWDMHDLHLRDRDVSVLLTSERLGGWRSLNLRYNQLGPDSAAAIADCPQLSRLRILNLRQNNLGDEGALALASSPYLQALTGLDVSQCNVSPEGLAALHERYGDAVRYQ